MFNLFAWGPQGRGAESRRPPPRHSRPCSAQHGHTPDTRHAETPEWWIVEYQLDSVFHIILAILNYCLQIFIIWLQIWPKLSANVASSWNSRLQHCGVSASLPATLAISRYCRNTRLCGNFLCRLINKFLCLLLHMPLAKKHIDGKGNMFYSIFVLKGS